nr:helix-turn-helix domain-containing protein [Endozoicomonas sp.]
MPNSITPALLTTDQAANYLGIAKTEIAQSRVTGSLSGLEPPYFIRIGKRVRYPIEALNEWRNKQPQFKTLAEQQAANDYPKEGGN